MGLLTQKEIRERAIEFSKEWSTETREKAEAQTFWNEFFDIFGIRRRRVATFEEPVKKLGDKRGSIDLFWKGMLIVEHKSEGQKLNRAYEQAIEYFPGVSEDELPNYILVSDFAHFRLYDLEENVEHEFTLSQLPQKLHLFAFISGYKKHVYEDEDPVNVKAAEQMAQLHDALLDSGYAGHDLEVLLIRLVYCLFADDTGIFPKDHFHYYIENRTHQSGSDLGSTIANVFQVLNTPSQGRQSSLDEDFQQLPYVNGALFEEQIRIPSFDSKMRSLLLQCCMFDWSRVSPAIFGSMFQSVMDKEKRRNLGAHYTSEKNIMKVVRALFLDDMYSTYQSAKHDRRKLEQLLQKLARMRFLDPACGCGNFLIITYRELRIFEIEILKRLRKLSGRDSFQLVTDMTLVSHIDVDVMFGIELEEFPARIAEVALWLTDHQMNMQMSEEFGQSYLRLPLKKAAHIANGNAIRMDWAKFVGKPSKNDENLFFILGNPPFVGKKARTDAQNDDMDSVFGTESSNYGILDYVCCWYLKASEFIKGTSIQVAFVSTNSITQGEQVSALWETLGPRNIHINFAHRTFKWSNEARGRAGVYCVIIGFSVEDRTRKRLFDYLSYDSDPMERKATHINPYLVDAATIIIANRTEPLCAVPQLSFGSMPNDNGHLLLTDEERASLATEYPQASKLIRPLISAHEFLHGENRWCLWLVRATPEVIKSIPEVRKRVEAVRQYRLRSKRPATVKLAKYPGLFGEIRQPSTDYVLIPLHSSEFRDYIPLAFISSDYVANNSCALLPNATHFHFGVLHSKMHMAWTRQICGRLEGRYRYSNNIVYNNFPWPQNPPEKARHLVEQQVAHMLAVRKEFGNSTLADLYDPNLMPKKLVDAHALLDAAVDSCYRTKAFSSELDRLEYLFGQYLMLTQPLLERRAGKSKKLR
ncbi:MAG: class I SAM-dependent DNA methyltransferase [Ignavibacteria bacterium]|nr:class I SAM-dependent DNA methyltransferase [Ignavibacteria bacterium]